MELNNLYSPTAEANVIGAILQDENLINDCPIKPDDFYLVQNQDLWQALLEMRQIKTPIDITSVCLYLDKRGKLVGVGGQAYLMGLIAAAYTTANTEYYAREVETLARRRRMMQLANAIAQRAIDKANDLDGVISASMSELSGLILPGGDVQHIGAVMGDLWDEIEQRAAQPTDIWGIDYGYKGLNKITGGGQPGELTFLSGLPGLGKSMLGGELAVRMARNVPGALFSLEMHKRAVARRMLSADTTVPVEAMRSGRLNDGDWHSITGGVERLAALNLWMSDKTDWSLPKLRAKLAQLKAQQGIQWFVLDYFMLLKSLPGKDEIEKTANGSIELKSIVRDLNIHGIVIHSMNKSGMVENRGGNEASPPSMDALRGSGQVIYDADNIAIMTGYVGRAFPFDNINDRDKPNMRVLWYVKGREIRGKNYVRFVKSPDYPRIEEYIGQEGR